MPRKGAGTMGATVQVTYRIPTPLYEKLMKIAESMFQPMPVVLRAAAAEYARNHRPVRHKNTGIALKWPDDAEQMKIDGSESVAPPDIIHTPDEAESAKPSDRPVTDSSDGS